MFPQGGKQGNSQATSNGQVTLAPNWVMKINIAMNVVTST